MTPTVPIYRRDSGTAWCWHAPSTAKRRFCFLTSRRLRLTRWLSTASSAIYWIAPKEKQSSYITHRLACMHRFDNIIVLEDGVVAEQGTHRELIEKQGIYFKMWSAQAEKYDV